MDAVSVALSGKLNGLLWETVIESLQYELGISIFKVNNDTEMQEFLSSHYSRVLIILDQQVTPLSENTDCRRFTDINPGLCIIVIDAIGLETFIQQNKLEKELLVKLLSRTILAKKTHDKIQLRSSQVTLLRAVDLIKLMPKFSLSNNCQALTKNTQKHLHVIEQWLDVCFHICLLNNKPDTEKDMIIPGWAMSTEKARAIIAGEHIYSDKQTLLKAMAAIENQLISYEQCDTHSELSSLTKLYRVFNLTTIEKKILIIILSTELDGRYARVLGYLNDDLARRRPTPTLLKHLLLDDTLSIWDLRAIIAGESNLAKFQLIQEDNNDLQPGSEVGLHVASEITCHLMVGPQQVAYGDLYLRFNTIKTQSLHKTDNKAEENLRHKFGQWRVGLNECAPLRVMQLIGGVAAAQWFTEECQHSGERLGVFDIAVVADVGAQRLREILFSVARMSQLQSAIVLVTGFESIPVKDYQFLVHECIAQLSERVARLVLHVAQAFVVAGEQKFWYIEGTSSSYSASKGLWKDCLDARGISLNEKDLSILATALRFKASLIHTVLDTLNDTKSVISSADILQAAKPFRSVSVPGNVRRMEASFTWQDIVLPEEVFNLLNSIPSHVRESGKVLDDWGYRARMPYGHGVAVLFSGPSGTGKTMAAQIIASELGVELFQVDLANTISKYIGETEKNLDSVFDAAEKAGAVLLFDEADALLFGKRGEVRDAHDRYANVEVAYLLQRMEIYSGLAILTTNLRQNLDKAFIRRLRYVVNFPIPAMQERVSMWKASFPPAAPLGSDVNFDFLARRLELTGGNIQQIAIRAAFSAAAQNEVILMRHIVRAACSELRKLGMNNAEKSLAELIPDLLYATYE